MSVNPFEKTLFACHRDWEEALVEFLASEAKNPDSAHWLLLFTGVDAKKDAVFSALMLSDILETKRGFQESADKLYGIYQQFNEAGSGAKKFEEWLRSGWLNVSRVANMLDVELRR